MNRKREVLLFYSAPLSHRSCLKDSIQGTAKSWPARESQTFSCSGVLVLWKQKSMGYHAQNTLQHPAVFHNKHLHSSCVWEQHCTTDRENLEAPQLTLNPWIPVSANYKGPQQSSKHLVLFSNCCFNNSSWKLFLFFSFILDLRFDLVPFFEWDPLFSWHKTSRSKYMAHTRVNCL